MTLYSYLKGYFWYIFKFRDSKISQKVLEQLDKPYKVQAFMNFDLKYTKDTSYKHEWQNLDTILTNRTVDCEEYSILAHEALKHTHYSGLILCMYEMGRGHATYLIPNRTNGQYISVGTMGLKYHKCNKDLDDNKNIESFLGRFGYDDWTYFKLKHEDGVTYYKHFRGD